MGRLHPQLEPYVAQSSDAFDQVKAAHLLNRLGWGGTLEEIEKVVKLGPQRAVDWLLDFPDAPADEISKTDVPDLSGIEGYPRTFEERRKLLQGKTQEERQLIQQQMNQANQQAIRAVGGWWLGKMVDSDYPAKEKLTFFWHGHFTTSARDERSAFAMWNQNELLRTHSAGNFGKFVKAISHDPAMLDYLNNQQNRKAHPNENYARELMELFTLGIGNYTENDVKEAARAFTGWAHDGEDFIYRKYDHDEDEKTFLGRRGNFDGNDIIDIILQQKACAPYIASRFWKFYVNDEVDIPILQSLGEVLRDNKYELRPMLRTLFTSKAFYDSKNIGSQIKSPVQLVVGLVRALQVNIPDFGRLNGALDQMGQVPLMPPNVKGWPGGRQWINTSTLFVRYNTALWLAGGEAVKSNRPLMDAANRINKVQPGVQISVKGTKDQIVQEWIDRLIQRPISDDRKSILLDAVGNNPTETSVRGMIKLILSMPEYQLC